MTKEKNFTKLGEFKKRIEFNDKLGLDDRDNTILSMVQNNPQISQEEIAKKIKLSQPSVGARLRKLQQSGILHNINGVNFKKVNLNLAKIDVNTIDTAGVIDEFKHCPFFVNALITTGKYNLCLLFTATDLKRLEGIVNHHLRGNPKVRDVDFNVIITTEKDFVHPLNIDYDDEKMLNCKQDCRDCI